MDRLTQSRQSEPMGFVEGLSGVRCAPLTELPNPGSAK